VFFTHPIAGTILFIAALVLLLPLALRWWRGRVPAAA